MTRTVFFGSASDGSRATAAALQRDHNWTKKLQRSAGEDIFYRVPLRHRKGKKLTVIQESEKKMRKRDFNSNIVSTEAITCKNTFTIVALFYMQ